MITHLSALPGQGHHLRITQGDACFTLLAAHVMTQVGTAVLVLDAIPARIATLLNVDDIDLHLHCERRTWVQMPDVAHHDAGLVSLDDRLRLWRGRVYADAPYDPAALRGLLRAALTQSPQPLNLVLQQVGMTEGLAQDAALDVRQARRPDFWMY